MIFTETKLSGAFLIDPDRKEDFRGYFARTFCEQEFRAHRLNPLVVQCNVSFNKRKGTLRGMHWQAAPHAEAKLVRCTRGAIHDVIVDLRPGSPTHLQHFAIELSADNSRMLYIPEDFAHGFQTVEDNTEVFYQMSGFFVPKCSRGLRPTDPALKIKWPLAISAIAEKDLGWPLW